MERGRKCERVEERLELLHSAAIEPGGTHLDERRRERKGNNRSWH